jgi:hypothetical protein
MKTCFRTLITILLFTTGLGLGEVFGQSEPETLEPGSVALLAVGERVSLHNPSDEPASLLVFFAPPGFIRTFAGWPVREGTS